MANWFSGKTAVAPIDFGPSSRWGVDTALEIIEQPENVRLIHIGNLNELIPAATWDINNKSTLRTSVEQMFKQEFDDPKYQQLPFEIRFGDPGHEITNYVREIDADLIVMPSQGRTGLSHLLIGSVAERVTRLAHCPVLILRR